MKAKETLNKGVFYDEMHQMDEKELREWQEKVFKTAKLPSELLIMAARSKGKEQTLFDWAKKRMG